MFLIVPTPALSGSGYGYNLSHAQQDEHPLAFILKTVAKICIIYNTTK